MKSVKNNTGANKKNTAKNTARTAKNTGKAPEKRQDQAVKKNNIKTEEYKNIHGLTAFQYGERINAEDGRVNLTAVNVALQAVRIKRDRNENTAIFNYLCSVDAGLCYAWQYINASGNITNFENINQEDIEDAIADARLVILSHVGEKYTQEIQKEARNAVGKRWTVDGEHKQNAERLLSVSLDEQKEEHGDKLESEIVSSSIFANGDDGMLHNKYLIQAVKKLELNSKDMVVFSDFIAGVNQTVTAEVLNISQQAVSKKQKQIIAKLQKLLVLENGKVKLAK